MNLHFIGTKDQAVSGLTMSRNQTEQYHPRPEELQLFFLLKNWMQFEPSEKTCCRMQQGIMFVLDLPLLHYFHLDSGAASYV